MSSSWKYQKKRERKKKRKSPIIVFPFFFTLEGKKIRAFFVWHKQKVTRKENTERYWQKVQSFNPLALSFCQHLRVSAGFFDPFFIGRANKIKNKTLLIKKKRKKTLQKRLAKTTLKSSPCFFHMTFERLTSRKSWHRNTVRGKQIPVWETWIIKIIKHSFLGRILSGRR